MSFAIPTSIPPLRGASAPNTIRADSMLPIITADRYVFAVCRRTLLSQDVPRTVGSGDVVAVFSAALAPQSPGVVTVWAFGDGVDVTVTPSVGAPVTVSVGAGPAEASGNMTGLAVGWTDYVVTATATGAGSLGALWIVETSVSASDLPT